VDTEDAQLNDKGVAIDCLISQFKILLKKLFFFRLGAVLLCRVCYRLYFRIKKAFRKFSGIKATLDTRGGEFCIEK
jgi:hypothetical protein